MWALGCVPWAARRQASERGPAPLPSPRCGGLSFRRTLRCPRGFGEGPSPVTAEAASGPAAAERPPGVPAPPRLLA